MSIMFFGGISRSIFHHSIDEINEINGSYLSFAAVSGISEEDNIKYILGREEYGIVWNGLNEFNEINKNNNQIIESKDTLYVKIKLPNGEWTNPALYLKGVKAKDYEVFLNGRFIYKSSENIFGKDLNLDIIYKDVIIPLGMPKLDMLRNIPQMTNVFDEDILVIKLSKGANKNITPVIEERSILLGEHRDIISYTIKNSMKKIVLNLVISTIAIVFAVLGIFIKGRERKILLSLSVFTQCMSLYGVSNISNINTLIMDAPIIWSYVFYLSLAFGPYTFAYFFEHVFGDGTKGFIKIIRRLQAISAFLLMCTVILYTVTKGRVDAINVGKYALYATLLVLVVAILIASIVGTVKGNSEVRILTLGISIYLYYIIQAIMSNDYINEAGLVFFILSLIVITARRFIHMSQDILNNSKELEAKNQELQVAWEEISQSKDEIFELNKTLEQRVLDRTKALEASNSDFKAAMEKLQHTQNQLIQSEKMGALGGLVAGVSHEINTPVGVSVTASSYLQEKTKEFINLFTNNAMKKSDLEKYLNLANESTEVILSNLRRASELIKSFKQVAVDQSDEQKRNFKLKEYANQVLLSLKPKLKKTKISIGINCDEELQINSFPGAFSQIITNLVMNSLIHAFDENQEGTIIFDIEKQNNNILFTYSDNGKGINEDIISKIFDPFFTTKRGKGGTGLGLNIVYNIVTQTLGGSIECQSKENLGTIFKIIFPVN
jgi:signal transduction histidine kinase